jgi:hypothetical protein
MNKSKKIFKKKSFIRKKNRISKRKKNIKQKGGNNWASWESQSSMNNQFTSLFYNRSHRVPFLSEMRNINPYE